MSSQEQETYAVEAFKLYNEGRYEELQKHLQLYPKVCQTNCISLQFNDFN